MRWYKNIKNSHLFRPTVFEPSSLCLHGIFCISVCTNLVLSLDVPEKNQALHSLFPPNHSYTVIRPFLSLVFSTLTKSQLSQPLLVGQRHQSLNFLCAPLLYLLQYVHVSLPLASPELDPVFHMWSHWYREEQGRIIPLNLVAILFLM